MSDPLRLIALDEEDLAVVSAHLQDSVIRVADMVYLPKTKRFALLAARFDWLGIGCGKNERCYTGLHFERVLKAAVAGFKQNDSERCLNLLSIRFTPDDAPAGSVILTFSGGAAVKLTVECLEAQMRDLGPRWTTRRQPGHGLEDAPSQQNMPKERA